MVAVARPDFNGWKWSGPEGRPLHSRYAALPDEVIVPRARSSTPTSGRRWDAGRPNEHDATPVALGAVGRSETGNTQPRQQAVAQGHVHRAHHLLVVGHQILERAVAESDLTIRSLGLVTDLIQHREQRSHAIGLLGFWPA